MSKAETKLYLYESKKAGVIDEELLTDLLEMVEGFESEEQFEAVIEAVAEIAEADAEEVVEEGAEEQPESIENVLEAVESFLENAKTKAETKPEVVEESTEDVNEVEERCKETKLNVYEACSAGYITEEERDNLINIIESVNN